MNSNSFGFLLLQLNVQASEPVGTENASIAPIIRVRIILITAHIPGLILQSVCSVFIKKIAAASLLYLTISQVLKDA